MAPLNQRKCPVCGTWNDAANTHCSNCGELLDPAMRRAAAGEAQREERLRRERAKESKFEKWLRELEDSTNPWARGFSWLMRTIFTVYMAVLSFFIWLIAFLSG